jgi:hypothetical protein
VKKVIFEWRLSGVWVGLLVFAVYWGIPFMSALLSGTLIQRPRLESWANLLASNFPDYKLETKYIHALAQHQHLASFCDQAYLTDKTHLIFAIVISIGAGIATYVIRNFNTTVIQLRHRGIPLAGEDNLKLDYATYYKFATHKGWKIMSGILGLFTGLIFFSLAKATGNASWWGYHAYGYSGALFALIETMMVYWGSRTIILMGVGSLMLAKFISYPILLRPFHPDGCNGLSPLGRQIFLLWLFALSLAFAIYVTLAMGYLGIEKTVVVWLLAILGTISIPALAVLPLLAALKSIQTAQRSRLAHFEPILNKLLDGTEQLVQNDEGDQAKQIVEQMKGIQAAHSIINSTNVWPFNPRALVGILIVNVVQIVLTLNALIEVFKK